MRHFANFYLNLQAHAENALQGLVDKYPNSEVGYGATDFLDNYGRHNFVEHTNLPSREAVSTTIPYDKLDLQNIKGFPYKWDGLKHLQGAHTHPMVLSAKAAGAIGEDADISNVPKYPSLQDFTTDATNRQRIPAPNGSINPSLVITKEYGEPVTYKYTAGANRQNFYSRLNSIQDSIRLGLLDSELYDKPDENGNRAFVKDISKPFLRRAALEEQMSNSKGFFHEPYINVERQAANPIPVQLPSMGTSRLGETVAAANAIGLAHGGYTLKKAYDERRKQRQADDVQLTNKYQ